MRDNLSRSGQYGLKQIADEPIVAVRLGSPEMQGGDHEGGEKPQEVNAQDMHIIGRYRGVAGHLSSVLHKVHRKGAELKAGCDDVANTLILPPEVKLSLGAPTYP